MTPQGPSAYFHSYQLSVISDVRSTIQHPRRRWQSELRTLRSPCKNDISIKPATDKTKNPVKSIHTGDIYRNRNRCLRRTPTPIPDCLDCSDATVSEFQSKAHWVEPCLGRYLFLLQEMATSVVSSRKKIPKTSCCWLRYPGVHG